MINVFRNTRHALSKNEGEDLVSLFGMLAQYTMGGISHKDH